MTELITIHCLCYVAHDSHEDTDWRYIELMPQSGTGRVYQDVSASRLGSSLDYLLNANLLSLTKHRQQLKNKAL